MEQFSLHWNNYFNQISDGFKSLLYEEDLVDVTLSCEGKKLKAHKMLLSACSTYFRGVFKENPCKHPVIVFRDVPFGDLSAIIEFIYRGEVSVAQEQLDSFLATAELLEIKGLTDESRSVENETVAVKQEPITPKTPLMTKTPLGRSKLLEKRKKCANPLLLQRLAKKTFTPPMKKRRSGSAMKPPNNPPLVLKNEPEDYEEDFTLDEDVNNWTEETDQNEEGSNLFTAGQRELSAEDISNLNTEQGTKYETLRKINLKPALRPMKEDIKSMIVKNSEVKPPLKRKEANLPRDDSVTIRPVLKEHNLNEPIQQEDDPSFCSEEAKTLMDEDSVNVPPTEDLMSGEEAPDMKKVPEEAKELEFGYYGCEVCKAEARPVADRTLLTQKCPICPCVCFCAHLLKEHMKVIHGWFNVQRRTQEHFPTKCPVGLNGRTMRKKCRFCRSQGRRKDTIYHCLACPGQPGLCMDQCFKEFHK